MVVVFTSDGSKILSSQMKNRKLQKRQTFKRDESLNYENVETPISMKKPLAASTLMISRSKYQPSIDRIKETPTPMALRNLSNVPSGPNVIPKILDLQNSQLMESPSVKQCFEALKQKLQKRNIRINSINFTEVDEISTSDDGSELNSTVIANVQRDGKDAKNEEEEQVLPGEANDLNIKSEGDEAMTTKETTDSTERIEEKEPVTASDTENANAQNGTDEANEPFEAQHTPTRDSDTSKYITKEECIRLFTSLTKVKTQLTYDDLTAPVHIDSQSLQSEISNVHELDNTAIEKTVTEDVDGVRKFDFKIPEAPATNATSKRRSVRIQQNAEKRKSIVPKLPTSPKRRRTTLNKTKRESVIVQSLTKADHCKSVLALLNKGDMKALQVLPQIGMKTAYCIITHRSLNGKFKNFKELAAAPFWRGKGWERFEKANNLK